MIGEKNKEEEIEDRLMEQDIQAEQVMLNTKVLLYVFVGIIAVFAVMIIINSYIFKYIEEIKTGYYLSILFSNFLFFLVVIVTKLSKRLSWSDLGWNKVGFLRSFITVLKIWGIIWIAHIIYMLFIVLMGIIPPENALTELLQKPTLLLLLANIFLVAVAAPVIEETLFRGLLLPGLRTYFGVWTAIIISAAIFSALHFELIGFFPRFALGIGLGYLYIKSGSLYPAIGLHSLNNLIAVLIISVSS